MTEEWETGAWRIDVRFPMQVEHFVVDGERGIFRWVYPRRDPLLGKIPQIVMSLIHHNHVRDDFEDFDVQMVDLSCDPDVGPRGGATLTNSRRPEIIDLKESDIISREELNEEANKVYALLMELSNEL